MTVFPGHHFKPHRHYWWVLLALALVLLMGVTAVGCGAYRPHFGKEDSAGVVVTATSGRFDFVVHLSGNDKLVDSQYREARARAVIARRCEVSSSLSLYSHRIGTGSDGMPLLSYAVGVNCIPAP